MYSLLSVRTKQNLSSKRALGMGGEVLGRGESHLKKEKMGKLKKKTASGKRQKRKPDKQKKTLHPGVVKEIDFLYYGSEFLYSGRNQDSENEKKQAPWKMKNRKKKRKPRQRKQKKGFPAI